DQPHRAFLAMADHEDHGVVEALIDHIRHGHQELSFERKHVLSPLPRLEFTTLTSRLPSRPVGGARKGAPRPLHAALIRFAFPRRQASAKRKVMRVLTCLGLLLLTSAPAFASATPWQEVTPNVKLRLISSDTRAADGTTLVGLEVD